MRQTTYLLHRLASALALVCVVDPAGAVALSQDGRGQVLIFPYYVARDGFDTLLSIVNTKSKPKAIKVTFYEGKRGVPVFRFNLYLSAHDVWAAAITASSNGAATLVTDDKSCTSPELGRSNPNFSPLTPNYGNDGEATDPSRTAEGHIEAVEMGEISDLVVPTGPALTFAQAITHVSGRPPGCSVIAQLTAAGGGLWELDAPAFGLTPPRGGITGSASLINVLEGIDYSVDAVALTSFRNAPMHTAPADEHPSLGDALPRESIFINEEGSAIRSGWVAGSQNPADPVTALLTANAVINEFVLDPSIHAATDWIVTMPTRRFYVGIGSAVRPFSFAFQKGGACEPTYPALFDREERYVISFLLPGAPESRFPSLCWETNVVTFNGTNALGPSKLAATDGIAVVFVSGQMALDTTDAALVTDRNPPFNTSVRKLSDDAGRSFRGLPMIGFAVQKYVNGNVGGVQANYGGNFAHRYDRVAP